MRGGGVIRGAANFQVEIKCEGAREGLPVSLCRMCDEFCSYTSAKKRFLSFNIGTRTCFFFCYNTGAAATTIFVF